MDLFEYQAKELFAAAGIPVPPSRLARTVEEAERSAAELGFPLAVKAQVLTGGRGKAGGVRLVGDSMELGTAAAAILSLTIKDKPVRAVLLEQGVHVLRELYLALTLDRRAKRPLLIFSTRGGMDIEAAGRRRAGRPAAQPPRSAGRPGRGAVGAGAGGCGSGQRASRPSLPTCSFASGRSIGSATPPWSRSTRWPWSPQRMGRAWSPSMPR